MPRINSRILGGPASRNPRRPPLPDVRGRQRPLGIILKTLTPQVAFASQRRPWDLWPQDEAKREFTEWRRLFMPQKPLGAYFEVVVPFPSNDPFRRVSEDVSYRVFFPQTTLSPVIADASRSQRQQRGAEEFRRVSDDGWAAFIPFVQPVVTGVPFFVGQPAAQAWNYWPQDEAKRVGVDSWRLFMPQTTLNPVFGQPPNQQQQGPVEFRCVSEDVGYRRAFIPQTPLNPVIGTASERKPWADWGKDEAKRPFDPLPLYPPPTPVVTPFFVGQPYQTPWQYWPQDEANRRDPWGAFRPFWQPPPVAVGYFVGQPAATPWQYWQQDAAKRERTDHWRLFMPQTTLTPWVASRAENRQQWGAEEYRRVSEDGWAAFRPFWQSPPTTIAFFIGQPLPTPWQYWQVDAAQRERTELWRLFMPQTGLTPQVAFQAENRQQQGPVEFRQVSEDGWSTFRFFWQPPPPPPAPVGFSVPSEGGGGGKRFHLHELELWRKIDRKLEQGMTVDEILADLNKPEAAPATLTPKQKARQEIRPRLPTVEPELVRLAAGLKDMGVALAEVRSRQEAEERMVEARRRADEDDDDAAMLLLF